MVNYKIHFIDSNSLGLDDLLSSHFLNEEDLAVINRYKMDESKKEKAVSLIFKRKYVKDFYLSKEGKPLSNDKYFNIAHSKGVVVYVEELAHPIGIDIEVIRPSDENLRKYISSEEECECIKDDETFFEIWTNKESLAKAYGSGLNTNVKDIPALPLNGIKKYKDKIYRSKIIKYQKCVISISVESEDEFDYKIEPETLIF